MKTNSLNKRFQEKYRFVHKETNLNSKQDENPRLSPVHHKADAMANTWRGSPKAQVPA